MTGLIKYEAACRALAECKAVDEVKAWADKAAAMQAYGRIAKDKTLEIDAAEIRIRAERRLGEMIAAQKADGKMNKGAQLKGTSDGKSSVVVTDDRREKPTLSDVGISKDLSSRAQKLAAVPEEEFENEVGEWRDRVKKEDARVTARLEKAGERAISKNKAPVAAPDDFDERDLAIESFSSQVDYLKEENDELRLKLLNGTVGNSVEAQAKIEEIISGLKKQIKLLEIELAAVKTSRDGFQSENSQLKIQCKMQRKEIEKLKKA